jgi:hypothetical protein
MDIFVEGSFDREVLGNSSSAARSRSAIYEIDSVDIPAAVLNKYGLTSGNKQRVVALSKEFAGLPIIAKVVCLVDRDIDHWFHELINTDRLRWSKYCSLECHFLTSEIVTDIVVTAGSAKIKNLRTFINSLTDTLRCLFALRLADRELGLDMKWVSLRKYLSRTGDSMVLDLAKYSDAVLISNAKASRTGEFSSSRQAWMKKLDCDIRLAARGHDYTALLAWSIAEFGGKKELANDVAVERLFVLLARSVSTISEELQ